MGDNFARFYQGLSVSLAREAGVADQVSELEEIAGLLNRQLI